MGREGLRRNSGGPVLATIGDSNKKINKINWCYSSFVVIFLKTFTLIFLQMMLCLPFLCLNICKDTSQMYMGFVYLVGSTRFIFVRA